jgi:hypothetical protein
LFTLGSIADRAEAASGQDGSARRMTAASDQMKPSMAPIAPDVDRYLTAPAEHLTMVETEIPDQHTDPAKVSEHAYRAGPG